MHEVLARLEAIERLLAANQQLLNEQAMLRKEVLSFKEACVYLQMSASHLYKLTSSSQIPHFCPQGKKLYFNRTSLDQWLQRNQKDEGDFERRALDFIIKKGRIA